MKKPVLYFVLAICLAIVFVACKKDDNEPQPSTAGTSGSHGSFMWSTSNALTVNSDSAFFYPSFTTILAYKNGLSNTIEINLSSLAAGTYSLSSSTGNGMTYIAGTSTMTSVSGTVGITANAGGKLSGNFSAVLSGGNVNNINGNFSNITQK